MQNTDNEIGASSLGRTIIRWSLVAFWFNHVAYFKVCFPAQNKFQNRSNMMKKHTIWKITS